MFQKFRFGRRVPLPSTADIKHELRLMESADRIAELRVRLAAIEAIVEGEAASASPSAVAAPR